ncbi:MAG TPA: hypothetical protein VGS07_10170 [Thermoanaerobaculia bacterium]|jgi:hypothetical protein|nr:hypothetical protein [Thermoanaerobaculia bacterium]
MARQVAISAPSGLVQVIRLRWTKLARGGPGARARGAVPQASEVPTAALASTEGMLSVEATDWDDRNVFAEPLSVSRQQISVATGFRFGCVGVSPLAEGLQVRYEYDRANVGAPDRWFFSPVSGYGESPGRSLTVRAGEWVRVCHNGRFSSLYNGDWWYQQVTVNVAWFGGEPNGRIFLDREPAQELRMLADLW